MWGPLSLGGMGRGPLSLGGMVSGRCGVLCPLKGWLVGDVGSFVPWRDG